MRSGSPKRRWAIKPTANLMSDVDERLAALEEFAGRIGRLTVNTWAADEMADVADILSRDPGRRPVLTRFLALLAQGIGHRQRFERVAATAPVPAQPAPPPPPQVDQSAILRRNTLLLDWFEREVNISKSYSTMLTTIAYAGLLLIWESLGGRVNKVSLLIAAVLAGVSLISFVIFEMMKIGSTVTTSREFGEVVATKFYTTDFETEVGLVRARSIARIEAINRLQPLSFWLSTATGMLSAAVLMVAAVMSATGLQITMP